MLSEVFQNYQILPLQRSFEGRRINISMTHHLFPLVADMLADFILYPTSTELRQSPDDPLVRAKARRAVALFFGLLQAVLTRHGHTVSLDCIDHDPDIGWLIRYRSRDPVTITMLHDIAAGDPGPSDPIELGISITQVAAGELQSV